MGRVRHTIDPQDGIVIHGSDWSSMPDRIAVSMLRVAKSLLADGGVVFISALGPSPTIIFDHWLSWPTVRRSPEAIENLFDAAGMRLIEKSVGADPLLVCAGTTQN